MIEKFTNLEVTFSKANPESDAKARKFKIRAYTGAPVDRFFGKMVVDLAGMKMPKKLPILLNHNGDAVAGYADSMSVEDGELYVSGHLSRATEHGAKIAALADEGFPWTASIGFSIEKTEEVEEGKLRVNDRDVKGPVTVIRKSRLFETSMVTAGPADPDTEAKVFNKEKTQMADTPTPQPTIEQPAAPAPAPQPTAADFRKQLADFLAAFPAEHRDFALEKFQAGATIEQARSALLDIVLEKQKQAAEQAPAPRTNPPVRVPFQASSEGSEDEIRATLGTEVYDHYVAAVRDRRVRGLDSAVAAMRANEER